MPEINTQEIKDFLKKVQGQKITLKEIRSEFNILPGTKSFDAVRNIMFQLVDQKIVRNIGARGEYKVVTEVKPVQIFGQQRERRPPVDLIFPRDFETKEEMSFARDVVVREGDMILISGLSNYGKTTLAMNFCGENIDKLPVLMGNEYTSPDGEPTPRFLNRLDDMEWVEWHNETSDNFTLLPVRDDYAEHIIKDRINIIDWINIESGEHYMIGTILDGIKRQIGKGVAIVCIQKAEGAQAGRGGQFTKDFTDCELLIDKLGRNETLLTIGKVKEYNRSIVGKSYGYSIAKGVKIINFREVKKCHTCKGTGFSKEAFCGECEGKGWIDVGVGY